MRHLSAGRSVTDLVLVLLCFALLNIAEQGLHFDFPSTLTIHFVWESLILLPLPIFRPTSDSRP